MEENTSTLDIRAINEKIEKESAFIDLLTMEMNKVIVGQKHMVKIINWTLDKDIFY
jgi:MoxR-like ATPase